VSEGKVSEVAADQRWRWWPLLPLYPYGRRRTLVRELVPGLVWSFEQLQGLFYVAVPIRMTVLRLREGLLLYAPVPATGEVIQELRRLEGRHGPVVTIVLPTSSGLEHKLPVPAMARAFPSAEVWVSPKQWSFPLSLPPDWLGFPAGRTRVLFEDGVPHGDALSWHPLGPVGLGVGTFLEVAVFHRSSGALLVTDALVAIAPEPPQLFDADPRPLLFHARERGDQPLHDTAELRRRGWWRMVLFASYFRPEFLQVLPLAEALALSCRGDVRRAETYFGIYPFRWLPGWEGDFEALLREGHPHLQIAPVLERLVFPRSRELLLNWLRELARIDSLAWIIPAHYTAPINCASQDLLNLAGELASRDWASSEGSWRFLADLDNNLLRWGIIPGSIQK